MRKYDEGYALPFAVVVMLVLCLVAVSILTVSLHNLQNQQASIERMQDKYEAQGEVEKKVAEIERAIIGAKTAEGTYLELHNAKNKIDGILQDKKDAWTDDGRSRFFSQTVRYKSVEISYTIKLNGVIVDNGDAGTNKFKIEVPTITYESYTVTYLDTPASAETTEDTP